MTWRRWLGLIAGAAVMVRLAVLARYGGHPMRGGDQTIHLHDGAVLADVHLLVFPNAPFGIQAFVGAATVLARILSVEVWVVVGVANAFLGGVMVGLVGIIGRRLANPTVGLVAAGAVAVTPELVLGAVPILSEPLFTVLALSCVLLATRAANPGRLVAFGVLVGVAAAVRPVGLPLLGLALVAPGWRARARSLGFACLGALVVLVPLAVRASLAADAVVLSDLRTGTNWCIGRLSDSDGSGRASGSCDVGARRSPQATNSARMAEGWRLLRSHPEREPALAVGRLRATLDPRRDGTLNEINGDRQISPTELERLRAGVRVSTWMVLVAGTVGAGWVLWRRHRARILVAAAALLLVAPAATVGDPRYRVPVLPLLILVAVVPLPARTEVGTGSMAYPDGRGVRRWKWHPSGSDRRHHRRKPC